MCVSLATRHRSQDQHYNLQPPPPSFLQQRLQRLNKSLEPQIPRRTTLSFSYIPLEFPNKRIRLRFGPFTFGWGVVFDVDGFGVSGIVGAWTEVVGVVVDCLSEVGDSVFVLLVLVGGAFDDGCGWVYFEVPSR